MGKEFVMAERLGTIGFLGVGNMGAALARGVINGGLVEARSVTVFDLDSAKVLRLTADLGVQAAASGAELLEKADTVVLAVKPQAMRQTLEELAPHVRADHLFISIAAGIPIALLEGILTRTRRFIRVMPNTPAMVGLGAAGVAAGVGATPFDIESTLAIFASVGLAVQVEEHQIDAVTGLSGSGPAYVFHLMEALAAAGQANGLAPDVAEKLALQTVLGAGVMARETGVAFAELRRQVTSPKGTTEAGLNALADGGFVDLIERAVTRATERGRELGKLFE
jgi:pyrroline-5-carboxylate reductase